MPRFIDIDSTLSTEAAVAAKAAINITQISVLDYIADPSDTSSHQAGFQAAIDAAEAAGGGEISVPVGDWYISGLTIPKECAITISGQSPEIYPSAITGTTYRGSRLRRTGTAPILSFISPTVEVPEGEDGDTNAWANWFEFCRNVVVQDITLYDGNQSATSPLVDMKGATYCHFNRVVFYRQWSGASLLDMTSVFDTRFVSCYFLGGGTLGGAAAVIIRGASDTYGPCNAITMINTSIENYFGPGLRMGFSTDTSAWKPNLLTFINLKMESKSTSGPHIVIGRANLVTFSGNSYISHFNTSGPVVDSQTIYGLYGSLGFNQIFSAGWVNPSARLKLASNSTQVDLTVLLFTGPDPSVNVVTQDAPTNENIKLRIIGDSENINGNTKTVDFNRVATIFQKASATSDCQYVFGKTGLNQWSIGNPSNPSSDQQQFSITAADSLGNSQAVLRLRSFGHTSGSNPATATYRDAVINGFLNMSAAGNLGWVNFQNITPPAAPVGGYRLYATSGRLTVDGTNLALATDLTGFISSGGALGTPSSGTLTNCTGLPIAGITSSTSASLGVGSLEIGHASDCSVTRSAAGTLAIEGVNVATVTDQPLDLTTGESIFPRMLLTATSSTTLTNQVLRLSYFTARKTESTAYVRGNCSTAAVGATLTQVGVYSVASNGDLTLLASTNAATALWAGLGTFSPALTSGFTKTRGQRYAVGFLCDGASTAPAISATVGLAAEWGLAPRIAGAVTGQSSLPATISAASVADSPNRAYAALSP